MYNRLNDIKDFSFVNHKAYPVYEECLNVLNGFISYIINRFFELYNV